MKYTELQAGDIVIFKRYFKILKMEDYLDGNIISINFEKRKAFICYLLGWNSELDNIPFEKIIAKLDEAGEYLNFGSLWENSILLEE